MGMCGEVKMRQKIKKYTANYAHTNHNFVIQNLDGNECKNSKYYSSICIVKNILQRGKPTLMSSFLQKGIGSIQRFSDFKKPLVLISKKINHWERMIKGSNDSVYNPAKYFFENILDKILENDCKFIKNLILPEVLISDITQEYIKEFVNQRVDFYFPQAYLVIEIDGSQHKNNIQDDLDKRRDDYLYKHGIKTVRISTTDINNPNKLASVKIELKEYLLQHKILTLYKDAFNSEYNLDSPIINATMIMRYQILILELLKYGKLSLEQNCWDIELFDNNENSEKSLKFAIQDLFIWFACILKLQNIQFKRPFVNIKPVNNIDKFSPNDTIKIDFSLFQRYSDVNERYPDIYFVRTDYIDTYKTFTKVDYSDNKKQKLVPVDHYEVETANLVKYKFDKDSDKISKKIIKYLMWNLFLQTDETLDFKNLDFREGQYAIIKNVLMRNDTIGLLPTGSGKSLCYQLASILQPAPSFIVSPIISLMQDQITELNNFYFTRAECINSNKTANEKTEILKNFSNRKYFYLFISPERFQNKDFRAKLKKLPVISYAVVDEAHCLSEWGHDFRTSYLTLVDTIRSHCNKDITFIALTATASLSVLKDLKLAFGITNETNVKTPLSYARDELEFHVIDSTRKTQKVLIEKIKNIKALDENYATLIFTPYASQYDFGCIGVCNFLRKEIQNENIEFYSGKMDDTDKINIQDGFKNNEFKFLVATKAFGMGVNKNNIKYTFHYGIPSSLEALYQEAGRAGRAKQIFKGTNKAQCYILFSKENDSEKLENVWNLNCSKEILKEISSKKGTLSQDIKRQLYFLQDNFISTKDEILKIKTINNMLKDSKEKIIYCNRLPKNIFNGSYVDINFVEKLLYRLYQLGIIKDWTIDYKAYAIEVDYKEDLSVEQIKNSCQTQIQKYDANFDFANLNNNQDYEKYAKILNKKSEFFDKYLEILLEWTFDKFVGYRRQSLKNVYEACEKYIERIQNGEREEVVSSDFKQDIEGYFTVNEATHKMLYLSENPRNFQKVFELFYVYDISNKRTDKLKQYDEIVELKNILMRLLEEYPNNVALDMISGIVRFILNEFNNADGQARFEKALSQISKLNNPKLKQYILINILKICQQVNDDSIKCLLAKILFKYFNIRKYLIPVNKFLNDSYTNYLLIHYANKSLNGIMEKILK